MTNNISNLFNELPKTIVFIWCGFSIIFLKIFKQKINIIFHQLIKPNKKLIYISLCLIFFTIPDFIVSKLDLIDYSELKIIIDPVVLNSISFLIEEMLILTWSISALSICLNRVSISISILASISLTLL